MVGDRSCEKTDIPHGRVVDRRNEAIHRSRIASLHAFLERHAPAELWIVAVRIDEAVREILDRMAAGAGIHAVASDSAGEARRVFIGVEDEVVAVLYSAHELTIFTKVVEVVVRAK